MKIENGKYVSIDNKVYVYGHNVGKYEIFQVLPAKAGIQEFCHIVFKKLHKQYIIN